MKTFRAAAAFLALCFFAAGPASAQDRAAKQAEIRKAAATSLANFYKAEPKLKDQVAKSPGYAVFTTYGLSFLLGGSGGKGLVHDNKSGKDVFMNMGQASAGVQIGASQDQVLIVFKTPAALQNFVNKGWEFGAGGGASAGTGKSSVGGGGGENVIADAQFYTITKTGFSGGGAVAGTKFWKDKELN